MRILFAAFLLLPLFAQTPAPENPPSGQQARPQGQGRPMPEPKNLKVLKVPAAELMPIMRSYTVALGVRCDFCHVQGDFASDEKEHKLMARQMITMLDHVNASFPDGKAHVSCYTCHRGQTEPAMAPPAGATSQGPGQSPAAQSGPAAQKQ